METGINIQQSRWILWITVMKGEKRMKIGHFTEQDVLYLARRAIECV